MSSAGRQPGAIASPLAGEENEPKRLPGLPGAPCVTDDPLQPAARGKGRVLLVEDDPDVAEVAADVLESLGFSVHVSGDADCALRAIIDGGTFDLVFSDIMMPGSMNGLQFAELLRTRYPALPVLLATGYSPAALVPGAQRFPVLAKPYGVQELARQVSALIRR